MAGAKVPLTFRIFKGDQLLREERLSLSVIKLGKVPSAHLKLDDETVSRMHAIIEVNGPGDVSIIDLGSTKGTFVNGQKVNKAKLQTGDTIVVGETRIELAIGDVDVDVADVPTRVAAPIPADIIASTPRPVAATVSAPPPAPAPAPAPAPMMTSPSRPAAPPAPPAPAPVAFVPPPMAPMAPPSAPAAVRPPPGMPGGVALYGTASPPPAPNFQGLHEAADDYSGARAVEVAAMLGDSVVGVKHCIDPRGGKITVATWTLFAIGIMTLVASIFAFYVSVDNAAREEGRRKYETECTIDGKHDPKCTKKPSFAFRERRLSVGYDWIAFGGFALSLVSVTAGLARMRKEKQSPWVRVGTAPDVEFATEGAPSASFPLVSPQGNEFSFNFGPGMEGEMNVGGQSTSLAELAAQGRTSICPLPNNAKIRVRTGKTTFLVSAVPAPRRHAMPLFAALESNVLVYFAGSLAAHLGFWFLLQQIPVDEGAPNPDETLAVNTTNRSASTSQDDPPPPKEEEKPDDGKDESGGTGTAMMLDEGKMGKKESDRATGQYKMKKEQEDPQLAKQQQLEQSRTAGILGSQALQNGGAFASLTGTGDVSSGFDESNVFGGLLGNEPGEMNGGFGYGRSGFGPGGGGTGWGTVGTGRYGTIGHGSGTGSGYGVGGGRGGMRGHTAGVPSVSIGQPNSQGDLDKAIIRRYIKRNEPKIRYCYEKQLLARPGLSGTVQAQFFIAPNGAVTSSTGTGVDPEVANCVADVIHGIEFPKPKGGGGVQVNYPFTFRTNN